MRNAWLSLSRAGTAKTEPEKGTPSPSRHSASGLPHGEAGCHCFANDTVIYLSFFRPIFILPIVYQSFFCYNKEKMKKYWMCIL